MRELKQLSHFDPIPWTFLLDGATLEESMYNDPALSTGVIIPQPKMQRLVPEGKKSRNELAAENPRSVMYKYKHSASSSSILTAPSKNTCPIGYRIYPWLVPVYSSLQDTSSTLFGFDGDASRFYGSMKAAALENSNPMLVKGGPDEGWYARPPENQPLMDSNEPFGEVDSDEIEKGVPRTGATMQMNGHQRAGYDRGRDASLIEAKSRRSNSRMARIRKNSPVRYSLYRQKQELAIQQNFYMCLVSLAACSWYAKIESGEWQARLERMHLSRFECVECGKKTTSFLSFGRWECGMLFETTVKRRLPSDHNFDRSQQFSEDKRTFRFFVRADHRPPGVRTWMGSEKSHDHAGLYGTSHRGDASTVYDPSRGYMRNRETEIDDILENEFHGEIQTAAASLIKKTTTDESGVVVGKTLGAGGSENNTIPKNILACLPPIARPKEQAVVGDISSPEMLERQRNSPSLAISSSIDRIVNRMGDLAVKDYVQVLRFDVHTAEFVLNLAREINDPREFGMQVSQYLAVKERPELKTTNFLVPLGEADLL